jgi:transposase-like protein
MTTSYATSTKLSPAQIREIRRRVANGEVRAALAREYGISRETLYKWAGDVAGSHPYRYAPPLKLTPAQITELKRRMAAGERRGKLAQAFDISINTVHRYARLAAKSG